MIEAFEAKQLHQALRLHFTTEKYDFLAYQGKLKATATTKAAFMQNNQRHMFAKVGRHRDPQGLIVSNMLENPKQYVTDLLTADAEDRYVDWKARQGKLTYLLREELERDDLAHYIMKMDENGMPFLLNQYIRKQVSPETVVIVDSFAHTLDEWAKSDHPLVAKIQLRLRKYRGFVIFDKNKARDVIKSVLGK